MRSHRFALLLAFCFVLSALAKASDNPWLEIRSQHFRILTDGNEKDARHVARELEQMREVFANRYPSFRLDSGPPLSIFAPRNDETADSLDPTFGSEKAQSGVLGIYYEQWEKQYAAFRLHKAEVSSAGMDGASSMNVIYHEYVHSILHRNTRWLPIWLDEGLAEFFGSTHFDGQNALVGYPSPRLVEVKSMPLIPVDTFLGVGPGSPYYHDSRLAGQFYAQSWITVHYMEQGKDMEEGKKLEQFFGLIDQGMDQKKAFAQIFGDTSKFRDALRFYIQEPTLRHWILRGLPRVDESQFSVRTLSPAESEAEIGGYHIWRHDYKNARTLVEQAIKDDPKLALAHENLGFIDFGEGKDADAGKEFAAAYDLDPKRYLSLYYKTMINALQGKTLDDAAIYAGCLRVVMINPGFAEAYVQLALYQLRAGNLKNALLMAQKASDLEPSRAGYFILTAHVLELMGQYQQAGDIASFVASRWTGPDHDEAVSIWDKIPQAQRPQIENLTETIPPGTQTTVGTVESITCADKEKGVKFELVLNQDGKSLHFHSDGGFTTGYSDSLWYGHDHFALCHHLEGMHALVRYKPAKDPSYAGNLAEFEIRVEMPEPPAKSPVAATAQTK